MLRNCRAGHFRLLRRLGAGGQAEVYLAQPAGGRAGLLAALKVARPEHTDGLHDEHGLLTRIEPARPGLSRLYTYSRDDLGYLELGGARRPFLALAYVPGRTVAELLGGRLGRGLPPALAVQIAAQTAAALDYLHCGIGVAHHDVRPANLIVGAGRRPQVTLIDLGAAESLAAPRRRHIYGAPGYLPPESLAGAPASPLVDVYGLGVTLRAMLGAQALPPRLAALIGDATERDPRRREARIPDMRAMHRRLADI